MQFVNTQLDSKPTASIPPNRKQKKKLNKNHTFSKWAKGKVKQINKKINKKLNKRKKTVKKTRTSISNNKFREKMTLECQAKGIIANQNTKLKMLFKWRACYSQKLWGISNKQKGKSVKIFWVREKKENIECFGKGTWL